MTKELEYWRLVCSEPERMTWMLGVLQQAGIVVKGTADSTRYDKEWFVESSELHKLNELLHTGMVEAVSYTYEPGDPFVEITLR